MKVIEDGSGRGPASQSGDGGDKAATQNESPALADNGGGMCLTKLATLPESALLDETAMASCLGTSPRTLRRIVHRGEMPQGIKLGGRRMWIAGKVIAFLTARADRETNEARRISRLFVGGHN